MKTMRKIKTIGTLNLIGTFLPIADKKGVYDDTKNHMYIGGKGYAEVEYQAGKFVIIKI